MRRLVVISALVAAPVTGALLPATAGASPDRSSMDAKSQTKKKTATIAGVAAANPDFSTLVTALKEAGLVGALKGKGPFTVFAPTNDAFAKIPADELDALLADKDQLTAVLQYHVLKGRVPSASLKATQTVPTLEGDTITIDVADGAATITDGQGNVSNIVKTDVKAKNGVIHVIDTVLLPPTS
jgi:uncharacterized surface protein with fasciclin (FAS1) repeats